MFFFLDEKKPKNQACTKHSKTELKMLKNKNSLRSSNSCFFAAFSFLFFNTCFVISVDRERGDTISNAEIASHLSGARDDKSIRLRREMIYTYFVMRFFSTVMSIVQQLSLAFKVKKHLFYYCRCGNIGIAGWIYWRR